MDLASLAQVVESIILWDWLLLSSVPSWCQCFCFHMYVSWMSWSFALPQGWCSHNGKENLEYVFTTWGISSTIFIDQCTYFSEQIISLDRQPCKLLGVITDPITLSHQKRSRETESKNRLNYQELNELMRMVTIFMIFFFVWDCWSLKIFCLPDNRNCFS